MCSPLVELLRKEQPVMVRSSLWISVWVENVSFTHLSCGSNPISTKWQAEEHHVCQLTVFRNADVSRPCKCPHPYPMVGFCDLYRGNRGNSNSCLIRVYRWVQLGQLAPMDYITHLPNTDTIWRKQGCSGLNVELFG